MSDEDLDAFGRHPLVRLAAASITWAVVCGLLGAMHNWLPLTAGAASILVVDWLRGRGTPAAHE